MGDDGPRAPRLSVIVPAHDRPDLFQMTLANLVESTLDGWELIIVLDSPTEAVRQIALNSGGTVLETPAQSGPALARNYGAQCAAGEVLAFIDSDVCVQTDTLELMLAALENDSTIDAVFGSYDAAPWAPGFASRFRNLLHHFTHQTGSEEAGTFWSGCGAIRRGVFLQADGFCPSFGRPSIEDIDLGMRLRERGHRIRVLKQAQVTHLKQWALWSMVRTDLLQRGIPWMQITLASGKLPNDLNLKFSQRLSVVLIAVALVSLLVAFFEVPRLVPASLVLAALFVVTDRLSRIRVAAGNIAAAFMGCALVAFVILAWGSYAFAFVMLPALACVIALNLPLYRCVWRAGGCPALYAIGLHWLYFLTCGLAAGIVIVGRAIGILGDGRRPRGQESSREPKSVPVIHVTNRSGLNADSVTTS